MVNTPRMTRGRPAGHQPTNRPPAEVDSLQATASTSALQAAALGAIITATGPSAAKRARTAGYPSNWAEISKSIRFGRAGGQCECWGECGAGHEGTCEARHGQPHPVTGSKVILTTAHLDRESAAWSRAGRPPVQLELDLFLGGAA